jgi:hypothetical protein
MMGGNFIIQRVITINSNILKSRVIKHPKKQGKVTVPHPKKDIAIGTLRNIFRQAGWHWR